MRRLEAPRETVGRQRTADRIEEVFDWPRPNRGCWAIPYGRFEPATAAPLTAAMASGAVDAQRQAAWRNDRGDRRGCDRERQRPSGASCLVGQDEPDAVDRSRSRLALPEWLAALRTGRSLQRGAALNAEETCLATAVYFEARGETLEGQLAVARVVMNRAASGRYPSSWCATVKQPAQFSFVRQGLFPSVDTVATRGGRPRHRPPRRRPISFRASRTTSSGTTPIMSRRRGAAA